MARPSRRDEILDAAIACFAENGNRGTSLNDIADRAGVTHTAVRYHFATRTDLILAVLAEHDARVAHENRGLLRGDPGALLAKLPLIAEVNLQQIELSRLFLVLETEALEGDDKVRAWFVDRRRALQDQIAAILRAGVDSGEFRPDTDADLKACEIICMIDGSHLQHLVDPEQVDLVAVLASYRDALIADLRSGGSGQPAVAHEDDPHHFHA